MTHNCDYLVNDLLIKSRIGKPIKTALYDPKYSSDDYTAEQLYALLEKQVVKIQMPLDMHLDGDGGDADDEGTAGKGELPHATATLRNRPSRTTSVQL